MENTHLLYDSFLPAHEYFGLMAIYFVLQRTPFTTTIASPTSRQEGLYRRDSLPSGCERVGIHIRCTTDPLSPVPVKALSIPYTNNKENDNGDHDLTQMKAPAIPYHNSTSTLPLYDAPPAIDCCTKPTGIDRLTCGSPGATIGLFSVLLLSTVLLFIVGWLIFRSPNKLKDEEKAIEMLPRVDQYQSALESRLKEKVRCASQADKAVQSSMDSLADDVLKCYLACSIPHEPAWRAARIREKMEELARLLSKELPRRADVSTRSVTVANTLDYHP